MIDDVKTTLMGNGIEKSNIHQEYFSSSSDEINVVSGASGAKMKAIIEGKSVELIINKDKTILDTLLDAGVDAPYSCTSGACSTCMAKVTKGSVEMEACFALDDDEVADGYILTCQAHPTSAEIEVEFED